VFESYRRWYRTSYAPRTEAASFEEGDFEKYGWSDALAGLHPVDRGVIDRQLPPLADDHARLLLTVGAGELLCAGESEPATFKLVHPDDYDRERDIFLTWIGPQARGWIQDRQDLDVTRMIPMVNRQLAWVLVAAQTARDVRVYYFEHDVEQRSDADILYGPVGFLEFWQGFFALARKKQPLTGRNWSKARGGVF
jgi:hypothetical protein